MHGQILSFLKKTSLLLMIAVLGFVFAVDSLGLAADDAAPRAAGAITLSSNTNFAKTGQCSTEVILAAFFKSRTCTSGTLVVAASSNLNQAANLEAVGYGPMKWDSKNQVWFIRIRDLEASPGMVTVASTECSAQGAIKAVPFGCDAKIASGSD
jgi:hypothetical protein